MTNEEKMAKRIHEKRLEKGMTMAELGALIGVQRSAVNKWEKGVVSNIKRSTIEKLAEIFEVSPSWLIGIDVCTDFVVETHCGDVTIQYDKKSKPLTDNEEAILKKFRELDDDGQRQLTLMLAFLASQHKDE